MAADPGSDRARTLSREPESVPSSRPVGAASRWARRSDGVHVDRTQSRTLAVPPDRGSGSPWRSGNHCCRTTGRAPTLVCPVLGDQGFWAGEYTNSAAGPGRCRCAGSSVDGLADRLHSLINNPTYRDRAQEVGDALAAEDGVGNAVRVLERLAP